MRAGPTYRSGLLTCAPRRAFALALRTDARVAAGLALGAVLAARLLVNCRVSAVAAVILAVGCPATAWAWGATGHAWVSGIAAEALPDEIPAFVRTPEAIADIAVLGRELDRSRGSELRTTRSATPAHYIDLTDDGRAMGIVPLDKLPVTREAYDTQLRSGGSPPLPCVGARGAEIATTFGEILTIAPSSRQGGTAPTPSASWGAAPPSGPGRCLQSTPHLAPEPDAWPCC